MSINQTVKDFNNSLKKELNKDIINTSVEDYQILLDLYFNLGEFFKFILYESKKNSHSS